MLISLNHRFSIFLHWSTGARMLGMLLFLYARLTCLLECSRRHRIARNVLGEWALCSRSHGTKTAILESKLRTGPYKAKNI